MRPVAVAVGAFVIVRLLNKYAPKAPAALIALILMTVIVAVFGLDQKGVKVLGTMPFVSLQENDNLHAMLCYREGSPVRY
jgi:MFS superfamily sulfate permease-like transporter